MAENSRTYIFQGRVKGSKQQRQITIGGHDNPWRVDDARTRALKIKAKMLDGVDPVLEEEKDEEEIARQQVLEDALKMTLRQLMEHYLKHKRTKHGPLRPTTQGDIRDCCEDYFLGMLDKPVATTVTRNKCLEVFQEITERSPTRANLAMSYLRALCNYARELHTTEEGEYTILAVNPVTRMFKIQKANPKKRRKGRIPLNRIGNVWCMLDARRLAAYKADQRTAVDWVKCTQLTGLRKKELSCLEWTDVDFEANVIRIRPDVAKNHNELVLPMSTALRNILLSRKSAQPPTEKVLRRRLQRRPPRAEQYVFASYGKKVPYMTNPRAVLQLVSRIAGRRINAHDLRRTFEDIAMECAIDPALRRKLLNHLAKDVHDEHYGNNPDPELLRPGVQAISDFLIREFEKAQANPGAHAVWQITRPRVTGGRPSALSTEQTTQLAQALAYPPTKSGLAANVWTAQRVAQYIKLRFSIHYSAKSVPRALKRWGMRPLHAARRGGTAQLNIDQINEIATTLTQSPSESGYECSIWSRELLVRLIRERFNVSYRLDSIPQLLRRRGLRLRSGINGTRSLNAARDLVSGPKMVHED